MNLTLQPAEQAWEGTQMRPIHDGLKGLDVGLQATVLPHGLAAPAISLTARQLAERVASALLGETVRVASLPPSGRPIATSRTGIEPCRVSIAHGQMLLAAIACRGVHGIGIDIVAPGEVCQSLAWCFTAVDQAGDDPVGCPQAIGKLWTAKEAAYKASRLDSGFQPQRVQIRAGRASGTFDWWLRGEHRSLRGSGLWLRLFGHWMAIAVAPLQQDPQQPADRSAQPE